MTRPCTRCGHPLGGAPFRPDPANAGRAHTDCNDETDSFWGTGSVDDHSTYIPAKERPMDASKLDAIAARLEAARERSEETLRDLPQYRLLTRAEADRQRLVRDGSTLLAVVREVAEIHRPGDPECADDHHDPARCPDAVSYCDACGDPAPCTTAKALAPLTEEETDGS